MTTFNLSERAPRPLRLLIAWPSDATQTLIKQLRPLKYDGAVDYGLLAQDAVMQIRPGYYHILALSPIMFGELTEREQVRIGRIANLLLLTPDALPHTVQPDRLNLAPASIAWQTAPELTSVCHFIPRLCTQLADGYDLLTAITDSCTYAKVHAPVLICADTAIWPTSKISPARKTKQSNQPAPQSSGIDISFGETQFGDHYHVGDVGRISIQSDGETYVSPSGDVGSIKAQPPTQRACTRCAQINAAGSRFCKKCGNALTQA
ncbi:MAG: hypothetical protein M9918_07900 [Anaerolineae bacterium]|nr:hypothetical protein [Anaerolineae bacterium]